MAGEEITQEEVTQAQKQLRLYSGTKNFSADGSGRRMSMLIGELNKIIMKPLEELYGSVEG